MANRRPTQHAAENTVFRKAPIASPICCRHRRRILKYCAYVNRHTVNVWMNVWTDHSRRLELIKSYQFHQTKVPWHQDGNNPSDNALCVPQTDLFQYSTALAQKGFNKWRTAFANPGSNVITPQSQQTLVFEELKFLLITHHISSRPHFPQQLLIGSSGTGESCPPATSEPVWKLSFHIKGKFGLDQGGTNRPLQVSWRCELLFSVKRECWLHSKAKF